MKDKFAFLEGKLLSSRFYPGFFPLKPNDTVANLGCGQGPQAIVYLGQYKQMIGVDLNKERLKSSEEATSSYGVRNYTTICASVEEIPLRDNSFDKIIAIGIMPCIPNPTKLCLEANRLLKDNGELLISLPAPMYFKFTHFVANVARFIVRRKTKQAPSTEWNPDALNQRYSLDKWITIVESQGFKLYKSRASTLFPPLHLYGVPRFWFSNDIIHKIDSFFAKMPVLKNCGQDLTWVFVKEKHFS